MKKIKIIVLISFIFIILFNITNIEKIILKKYYPIKFQEYVYKYSEKYEIDPLLIFAIIKTESNFNERSVSNRGAIGLMQLIDSTAREISEENNIEYFVTDLYKPEINIKIGIIYFVELNKYYNNQYLAIASYNAGIGNVNKWIESGIINKDATNLENIPFKETNNYVRKVLRNYKIYKKIYEK